jgi:hypothetical protein
VAAAFAAALNLVLGSTLVWTELVSGPTTLVLWGTLLGWWLAAGLLAVPKVLMQKQLIAPVEEDLFPAALGEYLKGNWFEVERLCETLLERDGRDTEAQLMLASVCRRAGRSAEGRGHLEELSRWDAAARWSEEIRREQDVLSDAEEPAELDAEAEAAEQLRPAA